MTARRSRLLVLAACILVLTGLLAWFLAGGGLGYRGPSARLADLSADEGGNPIPQVQLVTATRGPRMRSLSLPGTIKAWYAAPIYAQVSGYVRIWYKDYGALVHAGDLLASIDAPGLDQQFATAKANLDAAQDRYRLAALTAKRWRALAGTQAVSRQEVDVQVATEATEAAQVQAVQHEVARYQALEQFKNVVAPFDGVVTARNTDVGAYVNAAGGDSSARGGSAELFSVSDLHTMRVFVSVPQDYAAMLKPGLTATLSLPQFPGRRFTARLDTTANAFDPVTRTVITELFVDNPDRLIWPGTYADVQFTAPADPNILIVPQQALLFGPTGMQVAVVGADSKVHFQTVQVARDLGQSVQIVSGLAAGDRFINDPSVGLLAGETVHVLPGAPEPAARHADVTLPEHLTSAQRARIEAARGGSTE